ncbi:MAG TPA: spermidine/putrescine ABC transporter substrate-binding protein [Micromonosporaceae bacterium]|jgi:spermidine/putrescine transport system substrate-binding protein
MTLHPREGLGGSLLSRRRLLQLGALAAAAGTGALAGCSGRPTTTAESPVRLSRPDNPVRLPRFDDVPAIADGLQPETGGTLKVFNYPEYLSPDVLTAFGKQYGVDVEVTTFTTQEEAIAKLRTAGIAFDVYFPTVDIIGKVVAGKLLQPLNHSYLPNLGNAWPQLRDPFYDQGSQYSVPYAAFTTGVGYRTDVVSSVPPRGWDLLFDSVYKGKVYILDDPREAISMALLRAGQTDLNTEDSALIRAAGQMLASLIDAVNVKVGITGYQLLADGQASVHQVWSGDIINAQYYLPEDVGNEVLGYWYPQDLKGPVGTDTIAIPASADKPVLAHVFLNHLLDNDVAMENFSYTGYQPALTVATPERLVADEYVPEHLVAAVITPDHYSKGLQELQLSADGDALWLDEWAKFRAGS